jgi:hypothetical protein
MLLFHLKCSILNIVCGHIPKPKDPEYKVPAITLKLVKDAGWHEVQFYEGG